MKTMIRGARLRGRTIMLAAGLPAKHDETFEVPTFGGWDIDQAVVALARAVFSEGGRLVVRDDPQLTLLIAMIAGEYQIQRFAEARGSRDSEVPPSLSIYPGAERSDRDHEDSALLERLHLVRIEGGGRRDGVSKSGPFGALIDQEDPAALVCIGGSEDVLLQARHFAEQALHRPIFVLKYTGGAAALLVEDASIDVVVADVEITEQVWARARGRLDTDVFAADERRRLLEQKLVPYPIVMQGIVDRLAGDDSLLYA